MRLAYVLLYLAVEIGVFVALTLTLNFGWAVLITIAASVLGFAMLRWQGRKVFGELRRASRNEVDPRAPLADTATLAGSTVLLILPGIVSTLMGIALLAPPTRRVLRPLIAAFGARRMVAAMDRSGLYATMGRRRGDVIDGSVVDADLIDADVHGKATAGTSTTATMTGTRALPRGH